MDQVLFSQLGTILQHYSSMYHITSYHITSYHVISYQQATAEIHATHIVNVML